MLPIPESRPEGPTPEPFATEPPEISWEEKLGHVEFRAKLRKAAFQATSLYPGPVGRMLSGELVAWGDFGYRFSNGSRINELVNFVLEAYDRKMKESGEEYRESIK